jgi:hypothetical protein
MKDIPQKKLPQYTKFEVPVVVNVKTAVFLGCDVV